jgi:hypothetical protein
MLSPLRFYSIVNCWTAIITIQREEMMSFSFADCHIEYIRTDDFRAMYLVDGDAYDKDKINNAIGDGAKKEIE